MGKDQLWIQWETSLNRKEWRERTNFLSSPFKGKTNVKTPINNEDDDDDDDDKIPSTNNDDNLPRWIRIIDFVSTDNSYNFWISIL